VNGIGLISSWAGLLYVVLALYVLYGDHRAIRNRLFALLCLTFAAWAFGDAFMISAPDHDTAWFWYRASGLGWTLFPALMLHFFVDLTGVARRRGWRAGVVAAYLVGGVHCVGALLGVPFVELERAPLGWIQLATDSPWFYASAVYVPGVSLVALGLAARWGAVTDDPFERDQARMIVAPGVLVVLLGVFSSLLAPALGAPLPEMTQILVLLWVASIWLAIRDHSLLRMTAQVAAESFLRTTSDSVLLLDRSERVVHANRAARRLLGPRLSHPGVPVQEVLSELHVPDPDVSQPLSRSMLNMEFVLGEGEGEVAVSMASSEVEDQRGRPLGRVVVLRDRSKARQKEQATLRHTETHDPLTGLPNRLLLQDRFANAHSRAHRSGQPFAVVLVDVNDLKQVNATLGYEQGDRVLQEVADRLRATVRTSDTIARIGGDEFLALVEGLRGARDVEVAVQRLLAVFEEPFHTEGGDELPVMISAGVAVHPQDGADYGDLLSAASLAMTQAKRDASRTCSFYSEELGESFRREAAVRRELTLALERDELRVYYQPLVDPDSRRPRGVEALARWQHPERGLLGPGEFIATAERTGQILQVGAFVLRTACLQAASWEAAGLGPITVSVNVSARQLLPDGDLVGLVSRTLRATGISPSLLELELTESMAMSQPDGGLGLLQELHALGIRLVIDDFGTGFSSLSRLRSLPISGIKIDRRFVRDIVEQTRDRVIVQTIAGMARSLELDLVVEGIETEAQLDCLRRLDQVLSEPTSDRLQGFLFSRPIPAEELEARLEAVRRSAAPAASSPGVR